MTEEHRRDIFRISWPLVVLVGLLGAFTLGLFALIPPDMPEGRTALLGLLTVSTTSVVTVVVARLSNKVSHMSDHNDADAARRDRRDR